MIKKLIHVLKGIQSLTQNELEKRVLKDNVDFCFQSKKFKDGEVELFFDLSQVRWVSIGASFQLCLLIEKAKKNNIKVYIALPLRVVTEAGLFSENADQETLANLALKRARANDFLRVINFDKTVLCEHISNKPSVHISEDFQFSKKNLDIKYFKQVFSKENDTYTPVSDYFDFKYNYIFPLKWISKTPENYNELSIQIQKILSNLERGIQHLDILSLKNVILSELIKNVREHAGKETTHALFCIGLLKTSSIKLKKNEQETIVHSNEIEDNYLKGLLESDINSNIEIFFGDSGVGLCSEDLLEKYNSKFSQKKSMISTNIENELIKWSFNKWSTRKTEEIRGTKGLYRIHRIVNKYNGIIHVRAKHSNGGFQKGGKLSSEWVKVKDRKYNHPGTFVQIKICPNKEVLKYNVKATTGGSDLIRKNWKAITYSLNEESINLLKFTTTFKKILNGDFDNLILIFVKDKSFDINYENTQIIGQILLKVSELRHPKGILIYSALSIGKEALEISIDSANEMIFKKNLNISNPESIDPNFEEVYDPVLVVGENESIYWYGGNQNLNNILKELYFNPKTPFKTKLSQLECFKSLNQEESFEVIKNLQNDDSFIKISNNEEIIIDFTNIIDIYRNQLKNLIDQNSDFNDVCSPKLDIASKWINFKKILDKENSTGFSLALYTILIENKSNLNSSITSIFIDHKQQYILAKELARLIGLSENKIINISEDIDFDLPRRTKLFNENDRVLILTTIISSSETTRRLVKQVLRDKAELISILTLLNINKESVQQIRTWDNFTNILSLNKTKEKTFTTVEPVDYETKFKQKADKLNIELAELQNVKIYSPLYEIEENLKKDHKLPIELGDLFRRTNSLHYDHFGKYNDRHYTFFLDKKKILLDAEIQKKLKKEIFLWVSKNKIDDLIFLIPNRNFETFELIINNLGFKKKRIIHLKDINNKNYIIPEYAIFLDFGTLTGKTIEEILISNPSKEKLLILTVFSQLKDWKTELYKNISTVKSRFKILKESEQTSLFEIKNSASELVEKDIDISFVNLFELPIHFYLSIHCPICQHSEALEHFKLKKSNYLKEFANDRKDKLKIKSQDAIPQRPIDPYGSNKNYSEHLMDSELVIKMYEFKRLLELSLQFTQFRIKLFKKLYKINFNKEEQAKKNDSDLYAFLYLLSFEIIWFQKEPLILRIFRYLSYSVSKYIAQYDINDLTELLSKGNKKLGFNLATRYKYAAVTVLRSSNKFKFTESIYKIIETSVVKMTTPNIIGNNIFQNTFYHINSIHISEHNNSEKYYSNIENELKMIEKKDLPFTTDQSKTIKLVKSNNLKNQKFVILYKLEQVDIIKKLKNSILDVYNGKTNHPWPSDFFLSILIDSNKDLLNDIFLNKEEAISYSYFLDFQKELKTNYDKLSMFINSEIIPYLEILDSKENNLLNSYSYKKLKNNYLSYIKRQEEFETLIEIGDKNIIELIENHREYINDCNIINDTFINKEDVNKAEIFKLINSVPTDINELVSNVFENKGFKKCTIDIIDNTYAFICKSVLTRELNHILKNAIKRQNHNYDPEINTLKSIKKDLSNSKISVKGIIVNNYIEILIEYDNTDKFKTTLNKTGNLNDLNNELKKWNGSAKWDLQDNGLFQIKLKLVNYDR